MENEITLKRYTIKETEYDGSVSYFQTKWTTDSPILFLLSAVETELVTTEEKTIEINEK